jgi:hypothetical protein
LRRALVLNLSSSSRANFVSNARSRWSNVVIITASYLHKHEDFAPGCMRTSVEDSNEGLAQSIAIAGASPSHAEVASGTWT